MQIYYDVKVQGFFFLFWAAINELKLDLNAPLNDYVSSRLKGSKVVPKFRARAKLAMSPVVPRQLITRTSDSQ